MHQIGISDTVNDVPRNLESAKLVTAVPTSDSLLATVHLSVVATDTTTTSPKYLLIPAPLLPILITSPSSAWPVSPHCVLLPNKVSLPYP